MFFDNRHYYAFVERCRDAGITVPIVPGLKILTGRRQMQSLPRTFHVDLPEDLAGQVDAAADAHVQDVGVEWATRQADDLLSNGVPYIHFYIMSTSRHVSRVVRALKQMA